MRKLIALLTVSCLVLLMGSVATAGARSAERSVDAARAESPMTLQRLLGDRLQQTLRALRSFQPAPTEEAVDGFTIIDEPDPAGVRKDSERDERTDEEKKRDEHAEGAQKKKKQYSSFN